MAVSLANRANCDLESVGISLVNSVKLGGDDHYPFKKKKKI